MMFGPGTKKASFGPDLCCVEVVEKKDTEKILRITHKL